MTPRQPLSSRSRRAELMDAPDVDSAALDHAMRHLEIINRALNGYGPSLAGIRQVLPPGRKDFSLLDVGCGSGDTLRSIARWCRRQGLSGRLTGIELSEQSADRAAEACRGFPEITIRHQDIFAMPAGSCYDIVHSALVLHHFSKDDDVVNVLRHMGQIAGLGVIVNDLHRHPMAYHSIRMLTGAMSKSPILRNDAPLSVARAFTRSELHKFAVRAGLQDVKVQWHWAFRWLMTARGLESNDRT